MSFLKINNTDFSMYVNEFSVSKAHNYNSQTNAAGNTVIDYVNSKREIEIGIIPLDDAAMINLLNVIDEFSVKLSFRNPLTNTIEENVNCIIPENSVEYYTIQANNVSYKGFKIKFIEL